LGSLLADAGLRRRMGATNREIMTEHALDATLGTFESVYERVLGRTRTPLDRAV